MASVGDVQATTLASESTTATRSGRAVRVAVVGDSLSAGRSRSLGNGLDDETWMTYADGDGIEFAGGRARAGARPEQMAAAVRPVGSTDVLVVLAGTNAVLHEETVADVSASHEQIVATIGVHPAGPEQYAVLGRAFRELIVANAPIGRAPLS